MAYLNPVVRLEGLQSIQVLDFQNFTGRNVDPQTLILAADAIAEELQAQPAEQQLFEIVDRSPRAAAKQFDVLLEGALIEYDISTVDNLERRDQVVVKIECRLIDTKTKSTIALIQHDLREPIPEVTFENPFRHAMRRLGRDLAQWLTESWQNTASKSEGPA